MVSKSSKGTSVQPPDSTTRSFSTKKVPLPRDFMTKKARYCRLCRVICNSKRDVDSHRIGNKHRRNLKAYDIQQSIDKVVVGVQDLSLCCSRSVSEVNAQKAWGISPSSCDVDVGHLAITEHEMSGDSKKNLRAEKANRIAKTKGKQAAPEFIELITNEFLGCQLCRVACSSEEVVMKHRTGKEHEKKLKAFEEQQVNEKLVDAVSDLKLCVSEPSSNVEEKEFRPLRSRVDACGDASTELEKKGVRILDSVIEESKPPAEENQKPIADSKVQPGTKRSKRKARKSLNPKQVFTCHLCNAKCKSRTNLDIHSAGRKHRSNLNKLLINLQENKLCAELQCLNVHQPSQINSNTTPPSLRTEHKTVSEAESCMDFSKLQSVCSEYLGPSPSVPPRSSNSRRRHNKG